MACESNMIYKKIQYRGFWALSRVFKGKIEPFLRGKGKQKVEAIKDIINDF